MTTPSDSAMTSKADLTPSDAATMNKELLLSFIAKLVEDPEADLMALVPPAYIAQMQGRLPDPAIRHSGLADHNQQEYSALLSTFLHDPSACLVHQWFVESYGRQRQKCLAAPKPVNRPEPEELDPEPFYALIDRSDASTVEVLFPLSSSASALLEDSKCATSTSIPSEALKHIIRKSDWLWTGFVGNFAAKISDQMMVKVTRRDQSNHYLALQYLAEHAPDVVVPRPHGLVRLGRSSVLFMSYIPGQVLSSVWSKLTHENKLLIQQQLDTAFTRIRTLNREGRPLGTIDALGVEDARGIWEPYCSKGPISTASAFEDWLFSSRPHVSKTYKQFLQSLLPSSRLGEDCVFTHCDVRRENIMVDTDADGRWTVSGIFDWEEAGFYPAYWEAVKSTRTLTTHKDCDWYSYLPKCLAPSSFPQDWLVDHNLEATSRSLAHWNTGGRLKKRGKERFPTSR